MRKQSLVYGHYQQDGLSRIKDAAAYSGMYVDANYKWEHKVAKQAYTCHLKADH